MFQKTIQMLKRVGHGLSKPRPTVESLARDLKAVRSIIETLEDKVSALRSEVESEMQQSRHALLTTRETLTENVATRSNDQFPAPSTAETLTLEESYRRLEKLAPAAYRVWRTLVDVNAEAYNGYPTDSCAVVGHPYAEHFRKYLRPYLRGRVLDIGCGPQPRPWYLEDHPVDLIRGVDPLAVEGHHDFKVHRGVAEFLPWEDCQFETVVVSTSLDHVLLLDRSLEEIRRVLAPTGKLIVWVAYLSGAKKYEPYAERIEPVDQFHLFHFDRGWFHEEILRHFDIVEELLMDPPSWSCRSAFLTLTTRADMGANRDAGHNGRADGFERAA